MGGEEDLDRFDFDLCDKCARQLSSLIENWLKEKKEELVKEVVKQNKED